MATGTTNISTSAAFAEPDLLVIAMECGQIENSNLVYVLELIHLKNRFLWPGVTQHSANVAKQAH
ncbi:hypothetical protein [Zooshikella harenae]|uniref:Uncharacterized protein n=1 Tax=Zooshikella harenae TaxID=2827238 RepID=A0ABS5ZIQ7_9GAMM|nr:hypothetical protein [Zooshikella harenae]MBU2713810.1 hypothetical protein [Zooshikella harenae]